MALGGEIPFCANKYLITCIFSLSFSPLQLPLNHANTVNVNMVHRQRFLFGVSCFLFIIIWLFDSIDLFFKMDNSAVTMPTTCMHQGTLSPASYTVFLFS